MANETILPVEVNQSALEYSRLYHANPKAALAFNAKAFNDNISAKAYAAKTRTSTAAYNKMIAAKNRKVLATYTPAERAAWYRKYKPSAIKRTPINHRVPSNSSVSVPSVVTEVNPVSTPAPVQNNSWLTNATNLVNTGLNTWAAVENTRASIKAASRGGGAATAYQVPATTDVSQPNIIVPGVTQSNVSTPINSPTPQGAVVQQPDGSVSVPGNVSSIQEGLSGWFQRNQTYVLVGAGIVAVYLLTKRR